MSQSFLLDLSIYTTNAVNQGILDYSKYFETQMKPDSKQINVNLQVRQEYQKQSEQVVDEFLNYILDLSMRERLKNS